MPKADKLRELLAREDWARVASLLENMDAQVACDALLSVPSENQQKLFRVLSIDTAAKVAGSLPYYEAFVLLHARPLEEMQAIVERMEVSERLRFFDELPEESWQRLMDELGPGQPGGESKALDGVRVRQSPEARPAPVIEARQIEKSYGRPGGGQTQIIAPTSLSIEPGLIIAMLGPSGSGKSTLLRMLSGLAPPSEGEVLWHGVPLRDSNPNVAIVFQSFALFPWLTVIENVEVPLVARGMAPAERRRRAGRALHSVGLKGFASAYPKELSGGMKQRVGLARALAVEPEVLFMDEPFSALDVLTAENLRGELIELWLAKKMPTKTIFLVTHNIEEAVSLADRVLVLGRNPAKIRADFRIQSKHPRDRNSAEFILYVDFIYKLLTQPTLDAAHPPSLASGAKQPYQILPHARTGAIGGLLELLNDRGGKEDLYRVAEELRMEVDDLLPIVEAAALLRFAKSARGDVEITPAGKIYAEAEIHDRARLFREAALANVTILQQMHAALTSKSDHTMRLEFFRDLLQEHFAEEETQRQIDTALNWGRQAELLTYQPEADRVALYNPAPIAESEGAEG
jgi:NitT/TauT family transport system ATP-binding protein